MKCHVGTQVVFLFIAIQSIDAAYDPNFRPRKQSTLGGACSSNDACYSVKHSWCHVAAPTCGMGSCQCMPGYMQVFNKTGCHAIRRIGDPCSDLDHCADPSSECFEGVCTCNAGFSSMGGICAAENMQKWAGERCNDPVECIGHLTCVNNTCGCYPQYKVSGCCDCVKKTIRDDCVRNTDCIYSPNSICQGGRCQCDNNSRPVTYRSITDTVYSKYQLQPPKCVRKAVCVENHQQLRHEGETCIEPDAGDPLKVFSICKWPLVCTPCSSYTSLCSYRPDACHEFLHSSGTSSATTATIAVTVIGTLISLFQ